jgi:ribosomal protein L1
MPSDLNGDRKRDRKDANVDVLSRHRRSSIFLKETPVLTTTRVLPNRKEKTMRVMVIVKATKNSEAGVMPSEELLTEMGKFN